MKAGRFNDVILRTRIRSADRIHDLGEQIRTGSAGGHHHRAEMATAGPPRDETRADVAEHFGTMADVLAVVLPTS